MGNRSLGENRAPQRGAIESQAERILASEHFRDSPIQQRLISFLIDETLAGRGSDLKEYTIGEAVFHRGSDFDPRTDSIVRVQVSILRKKLAAYYDGPGAGDGVLIEIPRGHYVPSFTPRQIVPEGLVPAEPAKLAAIRRRTAWVWLGAGLVLGLCLFYFAQRWLPPGTGSQAATINPGQPRTSEWHDHPIWREFIAPDSSTKLVVGVPFMLNFRGAGLIVRDIEVNRPEDIASSELLSGIEAARGVKPAPVEMYTGLGEAVGLARLTEFFQAAGQDLPLIRSSLTNWQDVMAGNTIFLASFRFRTLGQELNRPTDFKYVRISDSRTGLRNLRPRPGESATYETSWTSPAAGTDYALVTVWRGTLPGRRIMAVGGTTTWGTQGAVESITDAASLRELRRRIGDTQDQPLLFRGLQVLLQIEVKDSQVVSATYVTHHWLG